MGRLRRWLPGVEAMVCLPASHLPPPCAAAQNLGRAPAAEGTATRVDDVLWAFVHMPDELVRTMVQRRIAERTPVSAG